MGQRWDNFFGHIFLDAYTVQMVSNTYGRDPAIINYVCKTLDIILLMKENFVEDQPNWKFVKSKSWLFYGFQYLG